MDPLKKLRPKDRSEAQIQAAFMRELLLEGWYCIRTHGNAFQAGFPDILAMHKRWGTRWVEVKRPGRARFTQDQLDVFTKFSSKNVGVWVVTHEDERKKIHGPANWHTFLYGSRGITLSKEQRPHRNKTGPEGAIQDSVMSRLEAQDWYCVETYGSAYQSGLPDIFACHAKYGQRWIEFKNPAGYKFTPAQTDVFPRFAAEGVGIWILDGDEDHQVARIHGPANWHCYLWPSLGR